MLTDEERAERAAAKRAERKQWLEQLSPEERSEWHKRKNYRFKYGISLEELHEMETAQGGQCAICGETKKLYLDHDHDTKIVRGLLCRNCNWAIGHFYDNPDLLMAAAAYLLQSSDLLSGPTEDTENEGNFETKELS